MNYSNRVKGNRPVGRKIFMQGGVCYNRAVPLAMAAIVDKRIIVPPEPGLMGAFGVALEVIKRIEAGVLKAARFDLPSLAEREVTFGRSFVCRGGKERCDRKCEIATLILDGKKFPFGGACNRYYNLRRNVRYNTDQLDLVRVRQMLIFDTYGPRPEDRPPGGTLPRIGISKSFLVNTYYPLYANFFNALGFEVVLPDEPSREGISSRNAPFCFPAELAHGFFYRLLEMENPPEWVFIPHFQSIPAQNGNASAQVCPFVQGEPFLLKTTFADQLKRKGIRVLSPMLNLVRGLGQAEAPMVEMALKLGVSKNAARRAFHLALDRQLQCLEQMKRYGKQALAELEARSDQIAVVLFGRPYNAFAGDAHMGIPHKIASRGVRVLPLDFLPLENEPTKHHMYWGMGQLILKAAHKVKAHPQLFGTYITNFSCGPDSFVIGYFRDVMGQKPSLTLELDSHTADAGLETRIEAFLDIVAAYRRLEDGRPGRIETDAFAPARTVHAKEGIRVISSSRETLDLSDPRVTLLFPSMGRVGTACLSAVFQGKGFNAHAFPPAGEAELKTGRANTSCKECLPLILTTGMLLNYVRLHQKEGEVVVYFMAGGSGPCRFGQYSVFMQDLIKRLKLPDVALLTLSSENAYGGMDNDFQRRGWWSIVISDTLEDIRSMLLANAVDTTAAMAVFEDELGAIMESLRQGRFNVVEAQLERSAARLRNIPLRKPAHEMPTVYLAGEIFVRRDGLSRQHLTEKLAQRGFATICAPVTEWMHYADYLADANLSEYRMSVIEKIQLMLRRNFKRKYEKRIKASLARSNLVQTAPIDIRRIVGSAEPFISPHLKGEAILTVGSALTEVVNHACGVIAIGPFGCMPNRLAEAILSESMTAATKLSIDGQSDGLKTLLTQIEDLPFLAIESDGSPFPQLIDAKIDTFCLRARRLHAKMKASAHR
jgi:predicted nucleotide-binding protein (sugar kinase/HSP70/actin superfamily)